MKKIVEYRGEKYQIIEDYGDIKSIKSPSQKVFLLIPKRGILIPALDEAPNFHIASGKLFLHGISFKAGRKERKGDSSTTVRNCTTTRYNNCTVFFFLGDDLKEIEELLCPQFG